MKFFDNLRHYYTYFAWVQALVATLGSLYFSEVLHYTPCTLCWYQRIFMYPLVALLGIGIYREDNSIKYYVLPLSITGLLIAIYHNFVYYGIINEAFVPCSTGVSCATRYAGWLGFITIPLLSAVAFFIITLLLLLAKPLKTQRT